MKPRAKVLGKIIHFLDRFEAPKTLLCRIVARDIATSDIAEHFMYFDGNTSNERASQQQRLMLPKKGIMLCLVDGSFPKAHEFLKQIWRILGSMGDKTSMLSRHTLQTLQQAIIAWSNNLSSEECEQFHTCLIILHPETVSTLTLGKSFVRVSGNRVRLRDFRSWSAIKDSIQSRIKSSLEQFSDNHSTSVKEDWSWNNEEYRLPCRFEEIRVQGITRCVALCSTLWMPNDVDAVLREGLVQGRTPRAAAEAMGNAFVMLGERPHGSLFIVDIIPEELDTPDADDATDLARTLTKAGKASKAISFLGLTLGKLGILMLLLSGAGYLGYRVWNASREPENQSRSISNIASKGGRDTASILLKQVAKIDTTVHTSGDDDAYNSDSTSAVMPTRSDNSTPIIAFEKSSRTRVPVLLTTPKHISPHNLAQNVRVEIQGPQRVSRYRVEVDSLPRQLPANTTRLNVVIDEPLQKGKYTVQLRYIDDETSSSASVSVNVLAKQNPVPPTDVAAFSAVSTTRHFYFGTQVVMGNKQLAILRKKTEALLGGSIDGIAPDMSFAYRFITSSHDTTATQYFPFDSNVPRGIQRGLFLSSTINSVEVWVNYHCSDGSNIEFGKVRRSVTQSPPTAAAANAKVSWTYKPNTSKSLGNTYKPNDIEVTVIGVRIDFEDVPVDNDEYGLHPVFATMKDVFVPALPTIREPNQFFRETIEAVKIRQFMRTEGGFGVSMVGNSGFLSIYDEDNRQVVSESSEDNVKVKFLRNTYEKGLYTVTLLISNLSAKPRNEEWQLFGEIIINTNATIVNPINKEVSPLSVDTEFSIPLKIVYK